MPPRNRAKSHSSLTSWRVAIAKTELLIFSTIVLPLYWDKSDCKIVLIFDRNWPTSKEKIKKESLIAILRICSHNSLHQTLGAWWCAQGQTQQERICCPRAATPNTSEKFSVIFLLWKQVMLINNITEKMGDESFHQTLQDCFNKLHVPSSLHILLRNAAELTSEGRNF